MKFLLVCLFVIFCALQYRLMFGSGSVQEVWRLQEQARAKAEEVQRLKSRNQALQAEVADLKRGLEAIEERARSELGMISKDETFYQFVRSPDKNKVGSADRSETSSRPNRQVNSVNTTVIPTTVTPSGAAQTSGN